MKRVKIMMLSLALFAVVGGALAFKAKFIKQKYCYTTTNAQTTCLAQFTEANPVPEGQGIISYTTLPKDFEGNKVCFTWDEENTEITTPLACTTPLTLTTAEQ